MTSKDLNLSLDRGLIQSKADHNRIPQGSDAGVGPASRQHKKRATGPTRGHGGGRQWIAVAVIAVANMLFLMLAGIWLTGHTYDSAARLSAAHAGITPELQLMLAQIDNRLNTIEQQLGGLQSTLDGQQALKVSDTFDIDKQLREALDQHEPTAHTPAPPVAWHVNLGNFDSREVALGLQQRLQAIGHATKIKSTKNDDKTAYLVILPGFSDRESAESVAKKIMEQTDLQSLWVAEGD